MILTTEEVAQLLTNEIIWCIEHPDGTLSWEYQEGFRRGLMQARYLIKKADRQSIKGIAQGILKEQEKYHE